MSHSNTYFSQTAQIAESIDCSVIEDIVSSLEQTRNMNGRVFVLGVGGSAANASHLVNDLRKLTEIEAYAPTDNVSELTARTNDEGWETVFTQWLETSKANSNDALFILSVGGGSEKHNISMNLVYALNYAKEKEMSICGVVGRDGGYTKQIGDHVLVVPKVDEAFLTPHTESFQAVVFHCIVSHPNLQTNPYKWESENNKGI